jgi:4-hydroxy-tetrahydrodipicolinate synthase
MNILNWKGIYSALLTPFDNADNIDFKIFEINIKAQMDAGINGLVLGGSLGEASTLCQEEKRDLLISARNIAAQKLPVVLNIAEQSTRDAVKAAEDAERNGANGLMVLPPMRYRADENETLEYFKTVTAHTSLPIMIYNNPHDYKIEITLNMFEQLAKIPTVQAIKESTRDVTNVTRLKNRFNDRFKILCGVDTLALEELLLGADGWVGGLVDAFPQETVTLYRLIKAGEYQQAITIYRWFLPLLELDIHPKFAQYIKLAATQNGLGSEYVRAPRLRLEGAERERILTMINTAMSSRPGKSDS